MSSGQQYLLNDIKKIRQKWLVKKSKFVWRKKNPPRAQIFRYFRIESRNKNKKSHSKFYWIEDRVPWTVVVGMKVFVRASVLQKAEKLSEEKLKDVGLFSGRSIVGLFSGLIFSHTWFLTLSKTYNFTFPQKTSQYVWKDSRNFQVFAWIDEQSCLNLKLHGWITNQEKMEPKNYPIIL